MAKKNQVTPKSFEEALAELEGILSDIEGGEVPLEESLVKYERGQFLVQHCRAVLAQAEKQVELLSKGPDGESLQATPMQTPAAAQPAPAPAPTAKDEGDDDDDETRAS